MNDYLISLFIDDEMDLDEKVEFVETVHASGSYTQETIELLEQEKLLRHNPIPLEKVISHRAAPKYSRFAFLRSWRRPGIGLALAAMLTVFLVFFMPQPGKIQKDEVYRFVIFSPQQNMLKIIGTFTEWKPVPMERIGASGYWTLTLKVPKGEHRYSYVIENGEQMADPTVVTREHDDFGGENSVIVVGGGDEPIS